MPECVSSRCRLFADDSIIYRNVTSEADCQTLQDDLQALEEWEETWGMKFNPSKCNILSVTRKKKPTLFTYMLKGQALEQVDRATYLGVDMSSDLSWHHQICKVASKANRSLGFIRRNVKCPNKTTKTLAYQSLVRPSLEYASTVWSPHQRNLIDKLEMVQRRAARYVMNDYSRASSVTSMLQALSWDTLESRRNQARLILGFKALHNLVAIQSTQFVPVALDTRGHSLRFIQIFARTNYYKYTFFPQFIVLWNQLPTQVANSTSLDQFKSELSQIPTPVSK